MCLLTFIPADVTPDYDALEIGCLNNPDGFGFAIVTPHGLHVTRSMDMDYALDQFKVYRKKFPHGDALFHSRISTGGALNVDNCHPFKVGGDRRTVVAHNGILPRKAQPGNKDARSDTRLFAEEHLPNNRFGSYRSKRGRKHIERWMGGGSKLVFLTVDASLGGKHAYILNERLGNWDQGSWWSNDSYVVEYGMGKLYQSAYSCVSSSKHGILCSPSRRCGKASCVYCFDDAEERHPQLDGLDLHTDGVKRIWTKGHCPIGYGCFPCIARAEIEGDLGEPDGPWDCPICEAVQSVSPVSGFCGICDSCIECGHEIKECDCYMPYQVRIAAEHAAEHKGE